MRSLASRMQAAREQNLKLISNNKVRPAVFDPHERPISVDFEQPKLKIIGIHNLAGLLVHDLGQLFQVELSAGDRLTNFGQSVQCPQAPHQRLPRLAAARQHPGRRAQGQQKNKNV